MTPAPRELRLTLARDAGGRELLHVEHDGESIVVPVLARQWDDSAQDRVRVVLEFARPRPLKARAT